MKQGTILIDSEANSMKMTLGTNIKRLRTEKGITQEQLAEAMNVSCPAVSKWERGETYPDIMLLQPLAFYFAVSLDELMGYDKEKVNREIEDVIADFLACCRSDWEKAGRMIENAYREYPNDYRIMSCYMWSRGVCDAEPDLGTALAYREEFEAICDKIIGGCTDGQLRLGAWKMKAILLHAEGKTEEALKIHSEKCGSWYTSFGQMNEQLFKKGSPEFLYWAKRNMYELADFAADKLVKSYFYDPEITYERKVETVENVGDEILRIGCALEEAYLIAQAESIFGRLYNDLKYRGGMDTDIIRINDKYLAACTKLSDLSRTDAPLFDALVKSHGVDDLLSYTIDCELSSGHPRSIELLKNEKYRAVIEKYKR